MRQGGSYVIEGKGRNRGEPKLVERTGSHPQGDRARDASGRPLNRVPEVTEVFAPPAADGASQE